MHSIEQLARQYWLLKLGMSDIRASIDWAIERLQLDQEGEDLDVVLLAAATTHREAFPLVAKIVERYCGEEALHDELVAGKYIVMLHQQYLSGAETIDSLDLKFNKLFVKLEHPSWLAMLCRNCEYATDMEAFQEPFEKEFAYIADLWAEASTRSEFESRYSRAVSNQHDAKYR